jgi:hypothetical protein
MYVYLSQPTFSSHLYLIMATCVFLQHFLHQFKIKNTFLKMPVRWCFGSLVLFPLSMLFILRAYSSRNEKPIYLDPIFVNIYLVQCVLEPAQYVLGPKFSSPQLEGRMTCPCSILASSGNANNAAFLHWDVISLSTASSPAHTIENANPSTSGCLLSRTSHPYSLYLLGVCSRIQCATSNIQTHCFLRVAMFLQIEKGFSAGLIFC